MARTYFTHLLALLALFSLKDTQVSAQMGTVPHSLFEYLQQNSNPQTNTQTNTQMTNTQMTNTQTNTNPMDPSASFFSSYTQQSDPTATQTSSQTGSGSFTDMWSSMTGGTQQTQQQMTQQQPPPPPPPQQPAPTTTNTQSSTGTNPMDFYNQLMQVVNNPSPAQNTAPQQQSLDPFTATAQTNNQVQTVQGTAPPKLLPFVPQEWNLAPVQTAQDPWAGSNSHGTTGWGHNTQHQGPTAWNQYYNPNHQTPAPTAAPEPHPMSNMMMVPRVRDMINKQATQFGDLAYYQQHGCIDPTPTMPGPGGIRPTQTLWYGCQSAVSKMVCARTGRAQAGPNSQMAMMMSLMNPQMARTFEKCLSPKMLTSMMFQGMSGGMGGGMNPAMMMAMGGLGGGGGGGGSMAMLMPMLINMMNPQPQQPAMGMGMGTGMGMGMNTGMGMNNNMNTGMGSGLDAGLNSGGLSTGGLSTGSSFGSSSNMQGPLDAGTASTSTSGGLSTGSGKGVYTDPSSANTLISQANKIPVGAAQPTQPAQSNPLGGLFGGLFGGGSTQTAQGSGMGGNGANGQVDCSSVFPLVMSRVMAAGEGFASPEAQEAIGEMRKQYLPYTCQEMRLTYTGMPLRLCCPGKVDPPTMFDLMRAKTAGGA